MKSKSCLSSIKAYFPKLTKKEQQLAKYILDNNEGVIYMTTASLAENAGVVKSVVVRFCKSIGFSGYTEFKLLLSRELAKNEQFNFTPYISENDNAESIFKKIFSSNIKTLHDTAAGLDMNFFNGATEALKNANNIFVYGIGTSAGIANDFEYRLIEGGKNAFFFTDVVNMKISVQNIKPGDVAVGISNSGRTAPTVDALRYAKEQGAETICVTSFPDSEITKYATFPLVIKTDEIQYPVEAISARIAHISVLDSLAVAISAADTASAVERAAVNHDLIESLRY